jgi:GDP/UDP-N,N'-diacetylbacillosamine 2-epimerase (hydrolysing)
MKKICFITTSRADYGTLNELVSEISKNKNFLVQLIVSGSHGNKIFGNTNKEITINKKCFIKKIKVPTKNINSLQVAKSFSECVNKFSHALFKIKPSAFVVFGDRYEMFAATVAAYIIRIPIIHIAGGEVTAGSLDEGFRHSISKLSNLHFPVTEVYRKRLIQLGENPKNIFNYGSLNLSKIKNNIYFSKQQIEKKLNFKFFKKNLILTYHPDTINEKKCLKNLSTVLISLSRFKNIRFIITSPNADARGIIMIKYIRNFIKKNNLKNFVYFRSVGSQVFLSLLRIVDGIVGNSSSGFGEAPFFKIGTINIGDRQQGRVMLPSIINCSATNQGINKSIKKIFSKKFKKNINIRTLDYGNGDSAKKIAKKIISFNIKKSEKKVFYDIKDFKYI